MARSLRSRRRDSAARSLRTRRRVGAVLVHATLPWLALAVVRALGLQRLDVGRRTELVGDAGRARRELGWAPTVGFEEIVARMVEADLR